MPRRLASSALLLALVLGASTTARSAYPPDQGKDAERAVRSAREAQNTAIAAKDYERVATFWVEDVTVTSGLGKVLRGRDEIRRAFQQDSITYRRTPSRVSASANWKSAWEEGTWEGRRVGWTGVPLLRGRYAAQWVNTTAGWRIRSELFVALECTDVACRLPFATVE